MKKMFIALALGISLFLIVSCSQVSPGSDVARTLPNGQSLSSDEVAQLEALAPQVEGVQRSIIPAADGSLSAAEFDALKEKYNGLLKAQFGNAWKKYVLVRKAEAVFDVETGASTTVMEPTWVDPETDQPVLTQSAARAEAYSDSPVVNGYYISQKAEQWKWPWGTFNNLTSAFFLNGYFRSTDSISAQVVDARGEGPIQRAAFSYISGKATGIPGGWWTNNIPFTGYSVVQFGPGTMEYSRLWSLQQ